MKISDNPWVLGIIILWVTAMFLAILHSLDSEHYTHDQNQTEMVEKALSISQIIIWYRDNHQLQVDRAQPFVPDTVQLHVQSVFHLSVDQSNQSEGLDVSASQPVATDNQKVEPGLTPLPKPTQSVTSPAHKPMSSGKSLEPVLKDQCRWFVQVASFLHNEHANHFVKELRYYGLHPVTIQTVESPKKGWLRRVVMGPFEKHVLAKQLQVWLKQTLGFSSFLIYTTEKAGVPCH